MTITCSVNIATSLDGFIARKDGSIDWLMDANTTVPQGEDCGYAEFMSTVDVLIMGRNTYEQVAGFEPWPYESKRVIVLTSREIEFRKGLNIRLESSSENPQSLLNRLNTEGCKHAYVDGGKVIQSFLSKGLIDKLTITVIPILIGEGRSLFASVPNDKKMKVSKSKAYEFGFIQTTYLARTDA
jgi:dihydrofolate reductase